MGGYSFRLGDVLLRADDVLSASHGLCARCLPGRGGRALGLVQFLKNHWWLFCRLLPTSLGQKDWV